MDLPSLVLLVVLLFGVILLLVSVTLLPGVLTAFGSVVGRMGSNGGCPTLVLVEGTSNVRKSLVFLVRRPRPLSGSTPVNQRRSRTKVLFLCAFRPDCDVVGVLPGDIVDTTTSKL